MEVMNISLFKKLVIFIILLLFAFKSFYCMDLKNIEKLNDESRKILRQKDTIKIKNNGLDIFYDKNSKKFKASNHINKYIYESFFSSKELCFHYQKFKKTVLIPLYIFGFEPYKSLPIVDNDYREVRYDSSLQDDWKNYYNLQMHQYDVESYFDTHPEEYNYFGEVRYGSIFHHIKKNGDYLVERINTVNIFDKERYLVGQIPGKKDPDLVCKAVQIKYDVYKVYDSNYYTNNEFKDLKYLEINKKEKGFRIYLSPIYNSVGVNTYLCNIGKDGKVYAPGFEQKDKNGYCGMVFLFDQKYMKNLDKHTLSAQNMSNIYETYKEKFTNNECNDLD